MYAGILTSSGIKFFIKDIAAGAVMFAAMAAMAIGLLIYVPKFL